MEEKYVVTARRCGDELNATVTGLTNATVLTGQLISEGWSVLTWKNEEE